MTAATHMDSSEVFAPYVPEARYFGDSDCVEYLTEDSFCVYDRIDEFLTLIYDETKIRLVGFKLKGFRYLFETDLKPLYRLNDDSFIGLVAALEHICSNIGDELFADDVRQRAYKAAMKLAAHDNVRLYADFKEAA